MKKTSQIALGASVLFFLAAGTVKFWPEERFSPRPAMSSASANIASPLRVLGPNVLTAPTNPSFAPFWLRRDPMPPQNLNGAANTAMSARAPGTLPGATPGIFQPAPAARAAQIAAPGGKAPTIIGVSFAAQNMPVGDVLAQVFHRAGVPYSLPGRLREPVNIIFVDAPLTQALDQTLSLTTKPHLTYRKEEGVYVVEADESDSPPSAQTQMPTNEPPSTGFRQGVY